MSDPDRHRIDAGQILLAGTGTLGETELYGRALLADARLSGKYLTEDAMALVLEEPTHDFSLFAYAWLASPTGVTMLRSTSYGTKLLRFRKELLASIPVPVPSVSLAARVAELVRRCTRNREIFFNKLSEARAEVSKLPEMVTASEMCAERSRRVIAWPGPFPSLTAWTFASTGGALGYLRGTWHGRLADCVEPDGIFNGLRFVRVNCQAPYGVDLLSQRDAFLIRPVPQRIALPLVPENKLFARPGTILIGAQGTLGEGEIFGRASLVTSNLSKAAFTQHLLRIVPKASTAASLFAFLTTIVGFRLLRSTAVGTKLLSMRTDLLEALPVPDLDGPVIQGAGRLVEEAFAARDEADRAESTAIRIIEEEVLPQWLA